MTVQVRFTSPVNSKSRLFAGAKSHRLYRRAGHSSQALAREASVPVTDGLFCLPYGPKAPSVAG